MPIRILDAPPAPWGDYGYILRHGMTDHLGRAMDGFLQLERTGPFIPPISFPGISALVVTEICKRHLESSGLTGFTFQPVHKVRIVELPWHTWNPSAARPALYPESGEPADYILALHHSVPLADSLGEVWEVVLSVGAKIEREPASDPPGKACIYLQQESWSGADLFRALDVGYLYASDRAQQWLATSYSEHVAFHDCLIK
jgi:hypothetical protein